ncbi:DMT family transporter [Sphingomonas sp. ST-64]|uniref:DMT family transporter n=1 Tax=Sphingomonas plantiphila TaxID=3163295 RepID=A0ABW8YH27_9SPHN
MIASPIWLPATLLAALFQPWRTAVQRRVSRDLSINAAGLVRYLYGLPVALVMAAACQWLIAPAVFPALGPWFLVYCLGGGLAQIVATNLLLMAFDQRNFVVGTAYSKTEAAQSALLSIVLLGEHLNLLGWLGIALGVAGVMILSAGGKRMTPGALLRALGEAGARFGIASGFFFALTAIAIRSATVQVDTPDPIRAALIVLAVTVALQTAMQGAFLVWRERDQVASVLRSWRVSGQVGLLSALGSACWFTGFATAPVALVRVVGQIEVAFTMAFGRFYLGERVSRSEVTGLVLVTAGVVAALAGTL